MDTRFALWKISIQAADTRLPDSRRGRDHCRAGASVWKFCNTDDGLDPDVVLVGIGVKLTFEVIKAAALLKEHIPTLRVPVVNVTDLMILEPSTSHPHGLSTEAFESLFTADRPVHFNYHGYANELKGLLFGRPNLDRITIASYMEEGSTTTPFNMMLLNHTSRYDVAINAVKGGARRNSQIQLHLHELVTSIESDIKKTQDFIMKEKTDPGYLDDVGNLKIDSSSLTEG